MSNERPINPPSVADDGERWFYVTVIETAQREMQYKVRAPGWEEAEDLQREGEGELLSAGDYEDHEYTTTEVQEVEL